MGQGIFISYRRSDTAAVAGRLFDLLETRFGDQIFMDVVAIQPGVNFVDEIRSALSSCSAVVVLIGPRWLATPDGRKRAGEDFVTLELDAAHRLGVTLVPVLVDGARLPTGNDLPVELSPLRQVEAVALRQASFDRDAAALCDMLLARAGVPALTKIDVFLEKFKIVGIQKVDERVLRMLALGAMLMNAVTIIAMGTIGQFIPVGANRARILSTESALPACLSAMTITYGYVGRRSIKYGRWAIRAMWVGAGLLLLQAALVGYAWFS